MIVFKTLILSVISTQYLRVSIISNNISASGLCKHISVVKSRSRKSSGPWFESHCSNCYMFSQCLNFRKHIFKKEKPVDSYLHLSSVKKNYQKSSFFSFFFWPNILNFSLAKLFNFEFKEI